MKTNIKEPKPFFRTVLYVAFFLALVAAVSLYPGLCPTNTVECFRIYVSEKPLFVACTGFALMYLSRGLFGKIGEDQLGPDANWKKIVARALHVVGALPVVLAIGWFVGSILVEIIKGVVNV
jgi:hypothetical protein